MQEPTITVSLELTAFFAALLAMFPAVFIALCAERVRFIGRLAIMVLSYVALSTAIFCILYTMFMFL